jgi:hypothetical protein
MIPHDVHYPHRPTERWETIPLLIGIVAVALIGVLVLTNGV